MTDEYQWTSTGPAAPWRSTLKTHDSWLADLAAQNIAPSGLFDVQGLRLEMLMIDTLHCVDAGGVAAHVIGNCFAEIAPNFGCNHKEQAAGLNADLKSWYATQSQNIRDCKLQGALTWERIVAAKEYPKLRAKGAQCRHMAKYCSELCGRFDSGSTHDRRRRLISDLLYRFYCIIEEGSAALSREDLNELEQISRIFSGTYMGLAREALAAEIRFWKATPKFHLFQHLLELQAKIANPTRFWAYADEDLQRHISHIAKSCSALRLVPVVLYKWVILAFDT